MIKTVLLTFSVTIAAVILAASFFLNTLLGTFGLVAMSIDKMQQMQAAQGLVKKMKDRTSEKKSLATKKFVKKAGKRVATAAAAAATVGTAAVAFVLVGLEVDDYCDEQKELQDDENLLNGTEIEFDLGKCAFQASEDVRTNLSEMKSSATGALSKGLEELQNYSNEVWGSLKALGEDVLGINGGTTRWRERARRWFGE